MNKLAPLVLIPLATMLAQPFASAAQPECCAHCGCHCELKKVCRLVCETKKVVEIEYECQCEDFCTPGPSKLLGERPVCDCNAPCGHKCEKVWQPSCGCVRSRSVLVKHEVTKEVPSYKCVVEYVCPRCCDACGGTPYVEEVKKPLFLGLFRR